MRLYNDDEGAQTRAATTKRKRALTRVKRRNDHEKRSRNEAGMGLDKKRTANRLF